MKLLNASMVQAVCNGSSQSSHNPAGCSSDSGLSAMHTHFVIVAALAAACAVLGIILWMVTHLGGKGGGYGGLRTTLKMRSNTFEHNNQKSYDHHDVRTHVALSGIGNT